MALQTCFSFWAHSPSTLCLVAPGRCSQLVFLAISSCCFSLYPTLWKHVHRVLRITVSAPTSTDGGDLLCSSLLLFSGHFALLWGSVVGQWKHRFGIQEGPGLNLVPANLARKVCSYDWCYFLVSGDSVQGCIEWECVWGASSLDTCMVSGSCSCVGFNLGQCMAPVSPTHSLNSHCWCA